MGVNREAPLASGAEVPALWQFCSTKEISFKYLVASSVKHATDKLPLTSSFALELFRIKPPSNRGLLIYSEEFTYILCLRGSLGVPLSWCHYPGIMKDNWQIAQRPSVSMGSQSWKEGQMSTSRTSA